MSNDRGLGELAVSEIQIDENGSSRRKLLRATVIVPVYNDLDGIERCLTALVRQSWPASQFDVIVVDNGSEPALRIDRSFPFPMDVIICSSPGSYAARNAAASRAAGEILAFTDADCIPHPNWLREGIEALEVGGRRCVVGGEVDVVLPDSPTAVALYQCVTGFQQRDNIRRGGFTVTANLFCYKQQFLKVGPFDERLLSGGDRDWCWRARQHGYGIDFVADALVHTSPRTSLRAAIRQARRVTAGRMYLKRYRLIAGDMSALRPRLSPLAAMRWILTNEKLNWSERVKVLGVAGIIKIASVVELLIVLLGREAERR